MKSFPNRVFQQTQMILGAYPLIQTQLNYFSFAYSAFAAMKIGMPELGLKRELRSSHTISRFGWSYCYVVPALFAKALDLPASRN